MRTRVAKNSARCTYSVVVIGSKWSFLFHTSYRTSFFTQVFTFTIFLKTFSYYFSGENVECCVSLQFIRLLVLEFSRFYCHQDEITALSVNPGQVVIPANHSETFLRSKSTCRFKIFIREYCSRYPLPTHLIYLR